MQHTSTYKVPRFSDRMDIDKEIRCQRNSLASTLSSSASSNVESGKLFCLRLESEDSDDGCKHVAYFTLTQWPYFWRDDPILFQTRFSWIEIWKHPHRYALFRGSLRWAKLNLIPFPGGQRMPRGLFTLGFVTFSASRFSYLWDDVSPTARAYDGHPLAELNPTRRGAVFQEWARQMLQRIYPTSIFADANPGTCVNGQRRSRTQAEFDFTMDWKKVEVKSAWLQWAESQNRWFFVFRNVKFPHLVLPNKGSFDVLYLVLFSPKGLHLVEHDMRTAIASNGRSTPVCGHNIHIGGARGATLQDSVDVILEKLCTGGDCSLVARASISDSLISNLCEKHADDANKFFMGNLSVPWPLNFEETG